MPIFAQNRKAPPFDRRGFLGAAAAAGVIGALQTARAQADRAEGAAMDPMKRNIERFERRLDLIRQSLDIPGMSVAVVHKQAVVLARGFGVVDVVRGIEATENTPYPVASLTKPFASAVIMRLVEQGKLDLDETFSTYDPGHAQWCARLKTLSTPSARNYNCDSARITVRHHLTHTAQGEPGTNYEYNGALFARLSNIVDALSPKGYVRSIEDDILTPLGMNNTALGSDDPNKTEVIARMAKPYRLDRNWALVESNSFNPPFNSVNAAVGIISTVLDLAKFDVAIDRDLVYSPQAKQQVWTAATSPEGRRFPYGLGWFVFNVPGSNVRYAWHYGWYPDAFSSLWFKMPDRELTLILLACTDRASSVFRPGNGDPLRSAFVTAFLDAFGRGS